MVSERLSISFIFPKRVKISLIFSIFFPLISEINGKKIENINEILTLFGKIKDIDNLSLTILKDGQKQEKDYEFY